MKKGTLSITTLVLIIVALFIPTYIAIGSFLAGPSEEYTKKQNEVTALAITDSEGKAYIYNKGDGETAAKMLSIFKGIFSGSQRMSTTLSNAILERPKYYAKVKTPGGDQEYIFYFSTNETSYYTDRNGTAYGIDSDSSSAFLKTECAMALYYKTPAPVLKTAFGTEIIASELSWLYLGYSGNYLPTDTKTTSEVVAYDLGGNFALSFDNSPDNAKVTVLADEQTIYTGTIENMSTIGEMKKNVTYRFEITAEWFKDKERNYCGSAKYIFTSRIDEDPAEFNLSENKIDAGQMTVINAYNVTDPSHIKVVFTPALNYNGEPVTPVFYGADGKYSAMFTIPESCFADNEQTGKTMKYVIEVSYGATKLELNLEVNARKKYDATAGNTKKADVTKLRTEEALANFAALRKDYAAQSANEKLWKNDTFHTFYSNTTKYALSFGRPWKLSTGVTYTNEFVQYKMKAGSEIVAVNDGKVLAVGENDYLGKYIVIDHGMGLQTWYLHLSAVSVEAGAEVSYKQAIGKSGSTGFIEDSSVGFAMMYTVNGIPTCPYSLTDKANGGRGLEETGIKIGAYDAE